MAVDGCASERASQRARAHQPALLWQWQLQRSQSQRCDGRGSVVRGAGWHFLLSLSAGFPVALRVGHATPPHRPLFHFLVLIVTLQTLCNIQRFRRSNIVFAEQTKHTGLLFNA